jgi:hypothetical protein
MISILSWMRDLPVDLYPGVPPSVQIRGKPATDPLNRGISQQITMQRVEPGSWDTVARKIFLEEMVPGKMERRNEFCQGVFSQHVSSARKILCPRRYFLGAISLEFELF